MATGAAQIKAIARQLKKIPDQSTIELMQWMVPRSEQIGGRMLWFGKRRKLTVKPRKRIRGQSGTTVVVGGVPAACWSIKSYGRRGGYWVRPKRAEALSLKSIASGALFEEVYIKRPATGDKRWDRLMTELDNRFVDVVDVLVTREIA